MKDSASISMEAFLTNLDPDWFPNVYFGKVDNFENYGFQWVDIKSGVDEWEINTFGANWGSGLKTSAILDFSYGNSYLPNNDMTAMISFIK